MSGALNASRLPELTAFRQMFRQLTKGRLGETARLNMEWREP